jgi:tetratricopeptide (TPR) repeat protein
MRTSVAKSVKKISPRSSTRASAKSTAKPKATRLKPATKRSPAGKARAHKATNAKPAKTRQRTGTGTRSVKGGRQPAAPAKKELKAAPRASSRAKTVPSKNKPAQVRPALVLNRPTHVQPPPQPTRDEAAALKAFEGAHREFSRGHFAEARNRFRGLVEKYPSVSEVTARARTYLAVAEARLRTELSLPRDADSLYDRGVIELNRGDYVAAQELFERALRREPEAAHIHYGLAATRARLGAIDTALKSLERALDLQPNLRIRAQRDQDLNALRSDPDFEQLIFSTRE